MCAAMCTTAHAHLSGRCWRSRVVHAERDPVETPRVGTPSTETPKAADRAGGERVLQDVEAVVLVGGKGTRLRPLTLSAPKPMLPTAGVPFLAHLLSRIRAAGVGRVVLGTSYLAETFSAHFGDG